MRNGFGLMIVGAMVLGLTSSASAQVNGMGFGGYPAGITSGSSYGFYPGGYNGSYSSPVNGFTMRPSGGVSTYYSSGFYGGTPGSVTYANGVDYSARSAYPYGYTPRYTTAPYTTVVPTNGYYRRGLFGRRYYR
jgi:hypothetical protein